MKRSSWFPACSRTRMLCAQGLPFTVFQPLYIYGPHTAKDCEQWFMERVLRGRPVPIPAPGIQLTTLTHVADVASMMAKVSARLYRCFCGPGCASVPVQVKGLRSLAGHALASVLVASGLRF